MVTKLGTILSLMTFIPNGLGDSHRSKEVPQNHF
jgi:hypothetical protein